MASNSTKSRRWSLIALLGAILIVVGTSAFYIDEAARFSFDFIEHHYDAFGMCILIGIVIEFVGCIAWTTFCDKKHRVMIAGSVFTLPWLILIIGSPIGGTNIHGPSAIAMMLILPSSVLAVVLLIMAAFAPRNTK